MKERVYCKATGKGIHTFYLLTAHGEYFLFNQNYHKGVHKYFERGVTLKEAMNYSKCHNDSAMLKTMSKFQMYIKYIEKEYAVEILEKTKQRFKDNERHSEKYCA